MATTTLLQGLPTAAPAALTGTPKFADIAVTATAKEFDGIYRDKKQHDSDFSAVLDRAAAANVDKILLTGMSMSDVVSNLRIAHERPQQCYITVGIHPYHASELEEGGLEHLERVIKTAKDLGSLSPSPVAAFGEIGLDYDRLNHASKEVQISAFRGQMNMFTMSKVDLPLFLHCRSAFDDFYEIMEFFTPALSRGGVVHSFVGTKEQMLALVGLGLDISVNGFSFADNESLKMVAAIPLDRLHLETDAPWGEISANSELAQRYLVNAKPLSPSKNKDKFVLGQMVKTRNESCNIERVAYLVAGLKGISVDEVWQNAWKNSTKMFGFGI